MVSSDPRCRRVSGRFRVSEERITFGVGVPPGGRETDGSSDPDPYPPGSGGINEGRTVDGNQFTCREE